MFEGWFASHADYDRQQQQGLLVCPVCQSVTITRRPSAARLGLGTTRLENGQEPTTPTVPATTSDTEMARMQSAWLRHLRAMVRSAEDVGARFSEEVRRMHAGDVPERAVRGTATPGEREALTAEGIVVMPVPDFLDDDRLQ